MKFAPSQSHRRARLRVRLKVSVRRGVSPHFFRGEGREVAEKGAGLTPAPSVPDTFDRRARRPRSNPGFLEVDMVVGMAILLIAIFPLAYSFVHERRLLRAEYARAAAIELVDGEMEILADGDGTNFPDGSQNYVVHAAAATHLPPGHFRLTKSGHHLRLEWAPDQRQGIGVVVRETTIR
jgi:hypothetical protein